MAAKRVGDIVEAVLQEKLLNDNGELPPWSSMAWQKVTDLLNSSEGYQKKINRDYLYTLLKNNRYDLLSQIRKRMNIVMPESQQPYYESDEITSDDNNESDMNDKTDTVCFKKRSHSRSTQIFKVSIPYSSYKLIEPQEKRQKTKRGLRRVWKLQNGWVDIFLDAFFEQHGLPCSYCILYHHVTPGSINAFISFKGKCSEQNCGAIVFGDVGNVPEPGKDMIVTFMAINTLDINHSKKRFLRQPKRAIISEEVLNNGVSQWRRNMADTTMDYGDTEPPNLYNNHVLTMAKQEHVNKTLGVEGNNPIMSIVTLKYEVEHKGSIHNIGCDPFYVHYWLPTQEFIYKSESRQKKWISMSVDATGSLVLPILRTINKIQSAHIFLYQMVVEIEGKTVPISQQLSEKQDMLSIHYWMSCWTNMGNKSPNECVSDYSKALIGAITRSFCNRKSLKEYVKACFDNLIGIENNLPECFVRIDIAHMVHILCRWKCLKVRCEVRDFYIRCICLLIQEKDIIKFKKTLEMIITVASSKTDGKDCNNKDTPAEKDRRQLINLISSTTTMDLPEIENDELNNYKGLNSDDEIFLYENQDEICNDTDYVTSVESWLHQIEDKSIQKSKVVGDHLNGLFCIDVVKALMNICLEFPLWSAVMVDHFSSPNLRASSARVEGYFSTLKSSIVKKNARMRVDKFLVTHLRAIRGDIKVIGSVVDDTFKNKTTVTPDEMYDNNYSVQNKRTFSDFFHGLTSNHHSDVAKSLMSSETEEDITKVSISNENIDHPTDCSNSNSRCSTPEETIIENWKNKANSPFQEKKELQQSKRSLYLEKHPEIRSRLKINHNISKHRLSLVKNGTLMRPIMIGQKPNTKRCHITNTCAFDSILQMVSTAYMDSLDYASYVNESSCLTLNLVIRLVEQGATAKFYEERLLILKDYCTKNECLSQFIEYNAEFNVASLIEKLFAKAPSIYQYHTCNNHKCGQSIANTILMPIDQNKLISGSFRNLQEAINMTPSQLSGYSRKCYRDGCSGIISVTKDIGHHLFIETNMNISGQEQEIKCKLFDIPLTIKVENYSFRFIAVIAYIAPAIGKMGHYVSYVYRATGFWELHDDISRKIKRLNSIKNVSVTPHILYFVRN